MYVQYWVAMATVHALSWYPTAVFVLCTSAQVGLDSSQLTHYCITGIKASLLCILLQTLKGGLSETRIEKRIVITGDCDIDHDEVSFPVTHLLPVTYLVFQQPG